MIVCSQHVDPLEQFWKGVYRDKYIYHIMRYLFGICKELVKYALQRNSDTIVLYRSVYGMSSELDIMRKQMNTVK